jgi:hypothetical protein
MFFELYLQDFNEDLLDVPVLIQNQKNTQSLFPNYQSDQTNWKLTRRFFLIDTKGLVDSVQNYQKDRAPAYVRYAKKITLRINLDPNNEEMIYTPLLVINYRARQVQAFEESPLASISLVTDYNMETEASIKTIRGIFIAAMIIFGTMSIIQLMVWNCLPSLSDDATARC